MFMGGIALFILYAAFASYIILVLFHSFRKGVASIRKFEVARKDNPNAFWMIIIFQSVLLACIGVLAILQLLAVLRK